MQLEKKIKKGKQSYYSLPFLENNNNYKDHFLIQQLILHQPHLTPHGQVTKAWETICSTLQEKEMNGVKVYSQNLNHRTLKNRFENYCKLVESWRSRQLRMTGVDDELCHERYNTLELLYDQYKDFKEDL